VAHSRNNAVPKSSSVKFAASTSPEDHISCWPRGGEAAQNPLFCQPCMYLSLRSPRSGMSAARKQNSFGISPVAKADAHFSRARTPARLIPGAVHPVGAFVFNELLAETLLCVCNSLQSSCGNFELEIARRAHTHCGDCPDPFEHSRLTFATEYFLTNALLIHSHSLVLFKT
jgi:hypothetical protein